MRQEWINRQGNDSVILFFNGWGMDAKTVQHLKGDYDVLMCYDYKDIKQVMPINLNHYSNIYVVAWSMGVWAASQTIEHSGLMIKKLIAINGTVYPIDNRFGIPQRVYQLTERTMNEKGRELFTERMFVTSSLCENPTSFIADRCVGEVCEELTCIREQWSGVAVNLSWDKIFIASEDVIFPTVNLHAWAATQSGAEIVEIEGGHYLWHTFSHWNELLD